MTKGCSGTAHSGGSARCGLPSYVPLQIAGGVTVQRQRIPDTFKEHAASLTLGNQFSSKVLCFVVVVFCLFYILFCFNVS
jgi:hypothetical protein